MATYSAALNDSALSGVTGVGAGVSTSSPIDAVSASSSLQRLVSESIPASDLTQQSAAVGRAAADFLSTQDSTLRSTLYRRLPVDSALSGVTGLGGGINTATPTDVVQFVFGYARFSVDTTAVGSQVSRFFLGTRATTDITSVLEVVQGVSRPMSPASLNALFAVRSLALTGSARRLSLGLASTGALLGRTNTVIA